MKPHPYFLLVLTITEARSQDTPVDDALGGDSTPPPVLTITSHPSTGLQIDLQDTENRAWQIMASDKLESWIPLSSHRVANSSLRFHLGHPEATTARFFKAVTLDDQDALGALGDFVDLTVYNYSEPDLPDHLLTPQVIAEDNTPVGNATTDAGAYLGRVLFYDKRLSANHSISCSSCHLPEHGFSDPRQFSIGFEGGRTGRNSMGLTNNRYYQRENYFWDERAATLEEQVLMPIQDPVEMGLTLEELVDRVSDTTFYPPLFEDTFGEATVTTDRISFALAQFVRSIASGESKYDEGRSSGFRNFSDEEDLGRRIFNGQIGNATCNQCHGGENFVPNNGIFNNGLENPYTDQGLGAVTGRTQDNGRFKVPSLRNIELTAPYMHDGRFATLEEVVEFYDSGVVDHPNLANQLRQAPTPPGPGGPPPASGPRRLNLSDTEKAALVAFLKTLTDTAVTTDPKFSDPFHNEVSLPSP